MFSSVIYGSETGSPHSVPLKINSCARPFAFFFCIDSRSEGEENLARSEWTEAGPYACMRLETFGERVCCT